MEAYEAVGLEGLAWGWPGLELWQSKWNSWQERDCEHA